VSDSIIFAKSAADVPQLKELWIAQQTPEDYDPTAQPGSQRNPFPIPAGTNEVQFDTLMHFLTTNYNTYVPQPRWTTNAPAPATNLSVLTLHFGAGVYQTHGDDTAHGSSLSWTPQNGWRLFGAGRDATTLQAVGLSGGYTYRMNVLGGGCDNAEFADLTLDANIHEGGPAMHGQFSQGIALSGCNLQIRRVRVKNSGSHMPGAEPAAMNLQTFGSEYDDYNLVVEDCEVGHPQYGNAYRPNCISISGEYSGATMHYYRNVLLRNCYLDGTAYDGETPLNPALYPFSERIQHGLGVGGSWGAIVEDNFVANCLNGYYVDEATLHDVTVRNNHFRNVLNGLVLGLGTTTQQTRRVEDYFRFEHNLVELDPHFYTNGDTYGTFGWRKPFYLGGDLKGPTNYIFNLAIITNNTFQYTDQQLPDANVGTTPGTLQAFRNAEVGGNTFIGNGHSLSWDNSPAYLLQQVDLVVPNRTTPVVCSQNRREDGTILEAYPYVLDRTLARPVVVEGQEVVMALPLLDGLAAMVVDGLPVSGAAPGDGMLHWRTVPGDAGVYLVSFYDSTNRLHDPRRTLITVQSRVPATNAHYFANGLLAYWKFNESSGTTLADASGNALSADVSHGLAAGLVTLGASGWTTGKRALHFNGASLSTPFEVDYPARLFRGFPVLYHPFLETATTLYRPWSMAFWFKADAKPAHTQSLFVRPGDGDSFTWLACSVVPSALTNDARIALGLAVANHPLNLTTPATISVAAWHQAVIVYDGVSASIYLDGALLAAQPCAQLTDFTPETTLRFGGGLWFDNFVGCLADVAIWNRPLAGTEITQLYAKQKSGGEPLVLAVAPSALSAQLSSGTAVTLTWQDNSMNESGFVLERSLNKQAFSIITNLPANTVTWVDTLPNSTSTCAYRLQAVNSSGASDYSNLAGADPTRPTGPSQARIIINLSH
jgi:hypothetical protein